LTSAPGSEGNSQETFPHGDAAGCRITRSISSFSNKASFLGDNYVRLATTAFEKSAKREETSGASEKRSHTTRNDVPERLAAQILFFFEKATVLYRSRGMAGAVIPRDLTSSGTGG